MAILLGAFVFMISMIVIEAAFLFFPTMRNYKKEVNREITYAVVIIESEYLESLFNAVKNVYYSTPEEIRHDQYSDAYLERILPLVDDEYKDCRYYLYKCRQYTEMHNALLAFYDDENDRLVGVLDGNEGKYALLPGQWISNENGEVDDIDVIRKTVQSDWYMPIAYGKVSGWNATNYVPLYDSNNEIMGYACVNIAINTLVRQVLLFLSIYIPTMLLILAFYIYFGFKYLDKRVLNNIKKLSNAAAGYSQVADTGYNEETSYFKNVDINTEDELEDLWETMVNMEKDISGAMKKIKESSAKEARISTELEVARKIQMDALPSVFPAFPDRTEFDIYGNMTPAKEISGDFYDFFIIDENHLGMVIADVSGKGVPAALFMMISKRLLRIRTMDGGTPAKILFDINNILCEENAESMFVTVWLGIMDTRTGEVVAANAGHEYPFITDESGTFKVYKDPHGLMCGAMEGVEYTDYTFTIPKGGKLFVYTDGVTEAQNVAEELFGMERLGESLNKYADKSPKEVIDGMHTQIAAFEGESEQFDDITMLCINYR